MALSGSPMEALGPSWTVRSWNTAVGVAAMSTNEMQ